MAVPAGATTTKARRRTIAVAGNPNSGKTTIFNALTGAHQRVGNWPGVTVERKVGLSRLGDTEVEVVDLPGIYSLRAFSEDERVARDFLLQGGADLVLVVVDASNLERNLFLALQLLELRVPMVLALNMVDVAEADGLKIDVPALERVLGVPVVATVGNRRAGLGGLKERLGAVLAATPVAPAEVRVPYPAAIREAVEALTAELSVEGGLPLPAERLAGVVIAMLASDLALRHLPKWAAAERVAQAIPRVESALWRGERTDVASAVSVARYAWLKGLVREVTRRALSDEERATLTDRVDRVLTNRYVGIPLFLGMIWIVFQAVFTIGNPLADLLDGGFTWLAGLVGELLEAGGAPAWLRSLVANGVVTGVGSVAVFLPNILILFLFIALMEDTGYMARAAFVMDRVMHFFGLHGKSFIPLFMGFGCNIPAIMATRTLENRKDRLLTILALPFIPCAARLTVFVLLAGVFFREHQGLVLFVLYLLGFALGMVSSRLFKALLFREEVAPLIMELPAYRMPRLEWIVREMSFRARVFLRKAGTVILLGSIVLWAAASLPVGVAYGSEASWIGQAAQALVPVLSPAGIHAWPIVVALLTGVLAKEMFVSTLGTLYGVTATGLKATLAATLDPAAALALMVFVLLYVPCLSTVAMIRRESGSWAWAALSVTLGTGLGYLLAIATYQVGSLF